MNGDDAVQTTAATIDHLAALIEQAYADGQRDGWDRKAAGLPRPTDLAEVTAWEAWPTSS